MKSILIVLMMMAGPTIASAQQSLETVPVHAQHRKQSFWRNRDVFFFVGVQTGAQIADGITTIQGEQRGYHEWDPISRALLGRYPAWDRMAPLGGRPDYWYSLCGAPHARMPQQVCA